MSKSTKWFSHFKQASELLCCFHVMDFLLIFCMRGCLRPTYHKCNNKLKFLTTFCIRTSNLTELWMIYVFKKELRRIWWRWGCLCECVWVWWNRARRNGNEHVLTLLSKNQHSSDKHYMSVSVCLCVWVSFIFAGFVIQIFHWFHFWRLRLLPFTPASFHLFIALLILNQYKTKTCQIIFKPVKIWFEFMKMIFFLVNAHLIQP